MQRKLRTYLVCLLVATNGASIFAQTTRTTSEILATALVESTLSRHDREVDFLKNTNHELSWIDEMEFRTETDEMDWERQEYLYRLSLNSTEEREAQRKLHRTNIQLAEIEGQEILHEELMQRYFFLVEYHSLEKEIRLLESRKLVLEDRLKVLRVLASAEATFNLLDLISTEDELHEIEQDLQELNGELLLISAKLNLPDEEALAFNDLVKITEIKARIAQLLPSPSTDPEALSRQADIEKSLAEYGFEEARNQRVLDFVQIRYAGRDDLNFSRELSFGMSFIIPVKSTARLDLNELELERIENENRLEAYLLRQAERLAETTQEINLLFEKHELATQQLNKSQVAFSLENYPQIADADPLILLKIKESELRRQVSIIDIEKDIYLAYLKLLDISGKVTEMPLKNYLTNNLEIIK